MSAFLPLPLVGFRQSIRSHLFRRQEQGSNNRNHFLRCCVRIQNDKNYVGIRELAETLGYKVDWDSKNKVVVIK